MFESIESLQTFLIWCRDNGVTHVKVGEVAATIDPNATRRDGFSEQIMAAMIADDANKKEQAGLEREPVDRELLFWSSKR
jgi:hypothetical protein